MKSFNKTSLVRLGVIALVALCVATVWFLKNKSTATAPLSPEASTNAVFEVTSIDMEELLSHGLPVMLAFGADGCEPCRAMQPALIEVHGEMDGKAVIRFIDAWKHTEEVRDYPLRVVPTQIFINPDGTPYEPSENLGIELIRYSYRETGEPAFTVHEGGLTADQMRSILADMGVKP